MHLLLTNDDGVDSPALVPFARALADAGHDVTVVVPDGERSWTGKAISRHAPVTLTADEREGVAVHTTSGHPADATQLGLHAVATRPVDVVVSGINIGFNHGAGFFQSSGTVGAAMEGWIAGVRGVAFSAGAWQGDWATWRRLAFHPDGREGWQRLAGIAAEVLADVCASDVFDHADLVSVNLPWGATATTPRRLTSLARLGYGPLFGAEEDGRWQHQFVELTPFEDLTGTDVEATRQGLVSITPVCVPASPDVPDTVRAALSRD